MSPEIQIAFVMGILYISVLWGLCFLLVSIGLQILAALGFTLAIPILGHPIVLAVMLTDLVTVLAIFWYFGLWLRCYLQEVE